MDGAHVEVPSPVDPRPVAAHGLPPLDGPSLRSLVFHKARHFLPAAVVPFG